ncbi:gluconate 2-dehydrogenase subunit 3 family protein [Virgibacillus sediminis]|uniref:Gluconate 2-dehydrogenase subunit 3 family protein n=1 Tax=Virgibacillus sediminis TaxID=202260 RepID=A0ABV7A4Y5_9BACI
MSEEKEVSRRKFLKSTGLTVGGLAVGSLFGGAFIGGVKEKEVVKEVERKVPNYTEALQFFTRKEDFEVLTAATEIIYPEDENGPGAIGLGVPYYIDKQLAGPWGKNSEDYMVKPFQEGDTPLTRGDIMLEGVRKLNEVSREKHKEVFGSLKEEEQIAILQGFESGNIKLALVSPVVFFTLLRNLTIEGCYSDPLYGGNKNMEGWKMKEYPGVHMSHIDVVESSEFVKKRQMSLSDMH